MAKVVLFNKPFHVLSQFTDQAGRKNLSAFIDIPQVYVAGRLDYDSEGLLVLTDNGKLQHQITHPQKKMAKTYWVQLEGEITDQALRQLQSGVELNDGKTRPAKVKRIAQPAQLWPRLPAVRYRKDIPSSWLSLTIVEGRNRQVRRMTAAVGFPTLRLIRYAVGAWSLDGIKPGEYRLITLHMPKGSR